MLSHILFLAVLYSLALQTALNGGFPTATTTGTGDETAIERACEPAADSLGTDATLTERTGRYRLILVADSGATVSDEADSSVSNAGGPAGMVASGLLTLRHHDQQGQQSRDPASPDDPTTPNPTTPLYGFTDIDPALVGAHRVGDPGSEDPLAPGVLVIERAEYGRRVITLRLGSLANRRDLVRYDGAYTVLRVREINKGGFSGSWRSGGGLDLSVATGYFCAREVH